MDPQILSRLPAALSAARRSAGLSQKQLALAAELDQSSLCAFEKGRRQVPGSEVLERIASALGLGLQEALTLKWAASHDRVLQFVVAEIKGAEGLVSLALQLEHRLSADEQRGVEALLRRVLSSKAVLNGVLASRLHDEEGAVD